MKFSHFRCLPPDAKLSNDRKTWKPELPVLIKVQQTRVQLFFPGSLLSVWYEWEMMEMHLHQSEDFGEFMTRLNRRCVVKGECQDDSELSIFVESFEQKELKSSTSLADDMLPTNLTQLSRIPFKNPQVLASFQRLLSCFCEKSNQKPCPWAIGSRRFGVKAAWKA